jgi:hypothetical protein
MLAAEHIRTALEALEAGRLPDDSARLHLLAAVRRAEDGLPWHEAIGRAGWLAKRQRDSALRRAAALLADDNLGDWALAERLAAALARVRERRARTMHPPLRDALVEALEAAACPSSVRQLYRLLTANCS